MWQLLESPSADTFLDALPILRGVARLCRSGADADAFGSKVAQLALRPPHRSPPQLVAELLRRARCTTDDPVQLDVDGIRVTLARTDAILLFLTDGAGWPFDDTARALSLPVDHCQARVDLVRAVTPRGYIGFPPLQDFAPT